MAFCRQTTVAFPAILRLIHAHGADSVEEA
jgi:hypothetical protein